MLKFWYHQRQDAFSEQKRNKVFKLMQSKLASC